MNKLLLRSLMQALLVAACALSLFGFDPEAQAAVNQDHRPTASGHPTNQQKKRRRVRHRARSAPKPVTPEPEVGVVSGVTPQSTGVVGSSINTDPLDRDVPYGDPNAKDASTNKPSTQQPREPVKRGVLNGMVKSLPHPRYPAAARATHPSGTVVVEVIVNEKGEVISAHALSGPPVFYATCVEAARAARFWPTQLSGQPVKITGILTFNFVQ